MRNRADRIGVLGRVDNPFDQRYENPTGFLEPSLAVCGGVRLTTL